jgi:hypothetical protein
MKLSRVHLMVGSRKDLRGESITYCCLAQLNMMNVYEGVLVLARGREEASASNEVDGMMG